MFSSQDLYSSIDFEVSGLPLRSSILWCLEELSCCKLSCSYTIIHYTIQSSSHSIRRTVSARESPLFLQSRTRSSCSV